MLSIKTISALLFCSLLLIAGTNFALATGGQQSKGTARVTANIPEFIVLHYYGTLNLNFETPTSQALDEGTNNYNVSWEGEAEGDQLSTSSLMDASIKFDGSTTKITLANVWAVRGFSKEGTAQVTIEVPSGKDVLKNGTDSTIKMSKVQVSDGKNSGTTIKTALGGMSKSSSTFGSVTMELDFSNTKRSGSHSGGEYTITASTI